MTNALKKKGLLKRKIKTLHQLILLSTDGYTDGEMKAENTSLKIQEFLPSLYDQGVVQ